LQPAALLRSGSKKGITRTATYEGHTPTELHATFTHHHHHHQITKLSHSINAITFTLLKPRFWQKINTNM
jgi:hypothetical protein